MTNRRPEKPDHKPKQPGRPSRRLTFDELPEVPTVKQVASFLGRNPCTIYEMIQRDEFPPAVRTKGRKVISKAKLAEWMGIPYQGGGTGGQKPEERRAPVRG